jgi:hypothetical protein
MKIKIWFFATVLLAANTGSLAAEDTPAPSNNISYPTGWQNWAAIAVTHRVDNNTLRIILGNDVAVRAARSGETNPWPDNAILGKVSGKKKDWRIGTKLLSRQRWFILNSCSKIHKNTVKAMVGAGHVGWEQTKNLLTRDRIPASHVIHR